MNVYSHVYRQVSYPALEEVSLKAGGPRTGPRDGRENSPHSASWGVKDPLPQWLLGVIKLAIPGPVLDRLLQVSQAGILPPRGGRGENPFWRDCPFPVQLLGVYGSL